MSINWTEDQLKVINERNKDILVSAAAGSGKTAVLVERIISRVIDERIDVDRLLVVTFTKAAAASMKEKIYKALEKKSKESDDEFIKRQLVLLQNADISTIDSFCGKLVREHFYEIDLDPDFGVCSEEEMSIIMEEAIDEVIEARLGEETDAFLSLSKAYVSRDKDGSLANMLKAIYKEVMSYSWPRKALDSFYSAYVDLDENSLFEKDWVRSLTNYMKLVLEGMIQSARDCIGYLEEHDPPDNPHPYIKTFRKDIELFETLLSIENDKAFHQNVAVAKLGTLAQARGDGYDAEVKAYANEVVRKGIKNKLSDLNNLAIADPGEEISMMTKIAPFAKELIKTTHMLMDALEDKKKNKRLYEFSDIEHFALRVLVDEETGEPTATANSLKEYYEEVMVDEYQDSNDLQESILTAISRDVDGKHNYFMVGDVKQSIYAFRKAKPRIFMEKFASFEGDNPNNIRIDLDQNFRSRDEVIDATNDVFKFVMKKDLGGVEYDDRAALKRGGSFPESDSVMFKAKVRYANKDEEAFKEASISKDEIDAHLIVKEIREAIGTQLVTAEDGVSLRPARYSDIVILHRSANSVSGIISEILKAAGIPAVVITKDGYFSSREVEGALALIGVLNNPLSDIDLIAALKNIFLIKDETFVRIRAAYTDAKCFYDRLVSFYEKEEDMRSIGEEGNKIKSFFKFFDTIRPRIKEESLYDIVRHVLFDTGYYDRCLSMPGGDMRRANLDKLLNISISFEGKGFSGLFSFFNHIEKLKKYKIDFGSAEGITEDAVRIMTFHKSKGLEFPIVIVAGLGKALAHTDREKVRVHPVYGLGLDYIDASARTKVKSRFKNVLGKLSTADDMGESLRVLYVALTRAKDKLIMVGAMDQATIQLCENKKSLDSYLSRLDAKCFFEWIIPALNIAGEYDIEYVSPEDLIVSETAAEVSKKIKANDIIDIAKAELDSEINNRFNNLFNYEYPHQPMTTKKRKYSVSELKHGIDMPDEDELPTLEELIELSAYEEDAIDDGASFSPAMRGTAVHRYMECFDFAKMDEENIYETELNRMKEGGLLDQAQYDIMSDAEYHCKAWIEAFFKTDLAKRMKEADLKGQLYKEKTFVMGLKASEVFEDAINEEDIIITQGIIDAYFIEDGDVILMDYKTDNVKCVDVLKDRYHKQIELYTRAIEGGTGLKVKEGLLYSFALGQECSCS